ncbi:hypothetical protein [Chromobacterium haemolyticum]|uniref:hypothetical protein n=2 Tax=Chromobacterium TaxID=535 RepID=UPI000694C891|nr:hypothetical protein [Chromobacterium haemolyticum]QOZ83833.1 hypothetical protein DXT74_12650 [Chromobacterium sp. Rain0013]BBH12499.1 hypothetical protein CH06BL_17470 [Chromobacterium haemolyticum]
MILIIIFKKAMQFHAQDFPIVWLDRSRPDGQQPTDIFATLDQLLLQQRPFVFIAKEPAPTELDLHARIIRKMAALWVKDNRLQIRQLIRGTIVIAPQAEQQRYLDEFAPRFEKFWGYPLRHRPDHETALSLAADLLAGPPAAGSVIRRRAIRNRG